MQQAGAYIMPGRDMGHANARFPTFRDDPKLLRDTPAAAAFTARDDLDRSIWHCP